MTDVLLVTGSSGQFRSVSASGHAGFAAKGKDIVCAAETIILRTSLEILQSTPGLVLNTDMASRGNLAFSVETDASGQVASGAEEASVNLERLKCTADFIRTGIRSLEDEYPGNVRLREIIQD